MYIHVDIDNSQIFPSSRNAQVGNTVTFKCNTGGYTVWFYNVNESPPTTKLGEVSNTLTIEKVSFKNAGFYFCHNPQNKVGRLIVHSIMNKYFVAMATLMVQGTYIPI